MKKRNEFKESFPMLSEKEVLLKLFPKVSDELVLKKLDLKILEVLKANGFSDNDLGTYYYKDVIKAFLISVIGQKIRLEKLLEQLSSPHSLFYYDIAKIRCNDVYLEYFHGHIRDAIFNAKGEKYKHKYERYYILLTITLSEFLIRSLLDEYFPKEVLSDESEDLGCLDSEKPITRVLVNQQNILK